MLLKNSNENIKSSKRVEVNSNNIFYSLNLRRQKNCKEPNKINDYSISIKYEENQEEEKLKLSIKKDEKELYSAEINNKKDLKDKIAPYSIKISYEDNYAEKRLSVTYKQHLKIYMFLL